jgi:phosphoribosylformylglycinamidine cyclo-ligase
MSEAYKQAGVDITKGYESVERIKKHVQRTMRPEVLAGLGGFGALFELPTDRYKKPVLVSGTDGVGTKLKLAFAMDRHDTIGVDAVAMCVNDIVVQGAEPLYFLDYLACGRVVPEKIEAIVKGIADGCEQAGCALIGGETAEMPGFYPDGEYDVAGFSVGIVEKDKIIDGSGIEPGDILIGLPSSGMHSNGFSLIRKVLLEQEKMDLHAPFNKGETLGEALLTPTRIYVKPILELLKKFEIKGMSHITGGGFYENIPRMLPDQCEAEIDVGSWPIPELFKLLQEKGDITHQDMFSTFNMGIGLVLAVKNEQAIETIQFLESIGEKAYLIGRVGKGSKGIHLGGVTL